MGTVSLKGGGAGGFNWSDFIKSRGEDQNPLLFGMFLALPGICVHVLEFGMLQSFGFAQHDPHSSW